MRGILFSGNMLFGSQRGSRVRCSMAAPGRSLKSKPRYDWHQTCWLLGISSDQESHCQYNANCEQSNNAPSFSPYGMFMFVPLYCRCSFLRPSAGLLHTSQLPWHSQSHRQVRVLRPPVGRCEQKQAATRLWRSRGQAPADPPPWQLQSLKTY